MKKYLAIARMSLLGSIQYRGPLLSSMFFYMVFIYIFMSLWRAIYQEGSVQGYTYVQIIWYLLVTEGITFSTKNDILRTMNEDIRSGSIAYLVGRPTSYLMLLFSTAWGQSLLGLGVFGLQAVVMGLLFVGPLPGFHPASLPFILISLFLGMVINTFFLLLIGLGTFYIEDNTGIYLIYQKLLFMLGVFLPVEFLPAAFQGVAKALPFSYIAWAPAKLATQFSMELFFQMVTRQCLWAAIILALTAACYRLGIKRLQVNGG